MYVYYLHIKIFYKSKIINSLIRILMCVASKLLLDRMRTKSNLNFRVSLEYNLAENFLYCPCSLSIYYAELNNTLKF